MPDMTYLLAPFVPTAAGLTPPEDAGRWIDMPCTLSELASRLSSAADETEAIKSVPDPWAHPRTFADAIGDSKHPLHGRFLREWRGLLALFAFAKEFEPRYHLRFGSISLSDSSRFDTVFRELAPAMALVDDDQSRGLWKSPVVVRLGMGARSDDTASAETHVVGLLNPACLITTGRTTSDLRIEAIPWMAEGLTDPLALTGNAFISRVQVKILRTYLERLIAALDRLCGAQPAEQSRWAKVRGALAKYREDCLPDRSPRTIEPASMVGGPPNVPLYRALWQPLEAQHDGETFSLCQVKLREEPQLTPPFAGIILIDPALVATLNEQKASAHDKQRQGVAPADMDEELTAKDIPAWQNKNLGDLTENKAELAAARAQAEKQGYFLATPDDFFTDHLLMLNEGNIPRHGPLSGAVLPLSPLALLVCPPSKFAERVRIDGRTVTFDVPIGEGFHSISKQFAEKNIVRGKWSRTDASLWPDFAHPKWRHYYAKFEFAEDQATALRAVLATSAAELGAIMAGSGARAAEFRNWSGKRYGIGAQSLLPQLDADTVELPMLRRLYYSDSSGSRLVKQMSSHAPEAILCEVKPGAQAAPVAAGLLILPPPARIVPPEGRLSADVAIDFGTTTTVGFAKPAGGQGDKIAFAGRLAEPILSTKPRIKAEYRWNFIDFFPDAQQVPPIPTAWNPIEFVADPPDLIAFKGVALFQPEGGTAAKASEQDVYNLTEILQKATFNLKWDTGVREERRYFLRQILVMSAAELFVAGIPPENIIWHFSYPQALARASAKAEGADYVEDFKSAVRGELISSFGYSEHKAKSAKFHLESEATGRFIVLQGGDEGGPFGDISIVLDIGGGTTDVLICSADEAIWSGSFRLAGMDFFTRSFTENPGLLRGLGLSSWQNVLDKSVQKDFALELLFSSNILGAALDEKWRDFLETDPEAVKRLRASTYVFLGGIAYYLGLVLKSVFPDCAGATSIGFGLCGRGARFPIRLGGRNPATERVGKVLQLFSFAVDGHAPSQPYRIKLSEEPKLEVVKGMVGAGGLQVDLAELLKSKVPHGMGLVTKPITGAPVRTLFVSPTAKGGTLAVTDIDPFLKFLDHLASHAGVHIGPRNLIAETLTRNALTPDDRQTLDAQPAFIASLRWLVRAIASGRDNEGARPGKSSIVIDIEDK